MTQSAAPSFRRCFAMILLAGSALFVAGCMSPNDRAKPQVEVHGEAGVTWASGNTPRAGRHHLPR